MSIEYAFVIANDDQVGSAALVGKLIHEATSIYHSFMVFDGARQMNEADLEELVQESATFDSPRCVVIAILSPFADTPFQEESTTGQAHRPSAETAFFLGYMQGRLPDSHVFVIRDGAESDFWIDPQIREISPRDQGWRVKLADGLSEAGVEVDRAKVLDADG